MEPQPVWPQISDARERVALTSIAESTGFRRCARELWTVRWRTQPAPPVLMGQPCDQALTTRTRFVFSSLFPARKKSRCAPRNLRRKLIPPRLIIWGNLRVPCNTAPFIARRVRRFTRLLRPETSRLCAGRQLSPESSSAQSSLALHASR